MKAVATPRKSRVMIVDDSEIDRVLAGRTLEQADCDVVLVEDGFRALSLLEEQLPDLLLLDLMMPGMDGFEVCRRLRQIPRGNEVPVLVMTGRDDVQSIHQAYEAGATDFASKPMRWPVLAYRVRYMLRASKAMRQLARSQSRLLEAQQAARMGHWELLGQGERVRLSEMARELLGLNEDEAEVDVERALSPLVVDDRRLLRASVVNLPLAKEPLRMVCQLELPSQPPRFIQVQSSTFGAAPIRGTVLDITELKRSEQRSLFLARHDPLTGLPNRQYAIEQIEQTVSRARRHDRLAAVLVLDLDKFNRVNESSGPTAGDALLRDVGDRLQRSLRSGDGVYRLEHGIPRSWVARLGGDEFALLVSDLALPQDAAKVAMRVLETLREPFAVAGQELVLSASVGISVFPDDGDHANALLGNADSAMNHAKAEGGACFKYYNRQMNASALERLSLESDLRHALARGEFEVQFQPQMTLNSHHLIGAEALVRWRRGEQGLVSPAEFIPLAEDTGLIVPLGEWVLYEACRQAAQWPEQPGQVLPRVSVNLSARQFRDLSLFEQVAGALAASGLAPERLELEITESCLMQDVELGIASLGQLRKLGCRIAVDDFGTGYSSLAYLKRFPLDVLKIDRSFVRGLPGDEPDQAICAAIIGMARGLGLEVVAEGVETPEQLGWLATQGCHMAQGYLIDRPITAAMMGERFEQGAPGVTG